MLGDTVSTALESVGITDQRVSQWLGKQCHCPERKERLNQLDRWARQVIAGKLVEARMYLNQLLESDK
jgi:hypothetical protein